VNSIINNQHSFSNSEFSVNTDTTHVIANYSPRIYILLSRFKTTALRTIQSGYFLFVIFHCCFLCCTVPKVDNRGVLRTPITPNVNAVPSIRPRIAPAILGVSFVKTLGRSGQAAGQFLTPMGLEIDALGQLYVADAGNNRIQVIDANGNFIAEFGSFGWREGEFDFPNDVALNMGNLYVADTGNNRIQFCNLVNRVFYPITSNLEDLHFDGPEGTGIGRNGEVYVIDTLNHRWLQFNRNHAHVFTKGSFGRSRDQLWNPTDLVVNPNGSIFMTDTGNNRIISYDFSGNPIRYWGEEGSELGQFREPKRIAIDEYNYLYVTDSGNRRIQIFTPEGNVVMEFTAKTFMKPCGIAVSQDGRIFVSDSDAGNIKVFQMLYKPISNLNKAK